VGRFTSSTSTAFECAARTARGEFRRRRFRLVAADEAGCTELRALLNAPQRPPISARIEAAADGPWHLQWPRR